MVAAKALEAAQALEQEEQAPTEGVPAEEVLAEEVLAEETAIEPRLAGETDPV